MPALGPHWEAPQIALCVLAVNGWLTPSPLSSQQPVGLPESECVPRESTGVTEDPTLAVPRRKVGRDLCVQPVKQNAWLVSGVQTLEKFVTASWPTHPKGLVGSVNAHRVITGMFIVALFIITNTWHQFESHY